ncbi:hypothetical protein OOT00_07420 [Desulfobotulus sp. H1]|uniref:Uncharacterized protein n=1 Tax=Desulfobotulus pelophilus TaxID=2823377 RepID=A0ABT3N8N8_9BACT|nr:hypothetical protein [Desulfobotulus pelophilus]MCW7753809.1 hypothetical protein [Desulfobotulus pelophilus]
MKGGRASSMNMSLWIALFLILLAFFAFLNVLSEPDESRRDRVRHSVQAGLGGVTGMGARSPDVWRHRFDDVGVMELTDLVSRLGPEGRLTVDASGRLWIRLPMDALFVGEGSMDLSPEGSGLLARMGTYLPEGPERGRVMVHVVQSPRVDPDQALVFSGLRGFTVAEALGRDMLVWGMGDLVPEYAYGQGRDGENGRVVLVFPGSSGSVTGSYRFRDFIFRIFSESP